MSSGEDIADIPLPMSSSEDTTDIPPIIFSGEDTTGVSPPVISAGKDTTGVSPPVISAGKDTTGVSPPVISTGKDTTGVSPPIIPSGEGITDVPPPVIPSGEGITDVPPPVIPSGEGTTYVPPPVNSSDDNSDNSVNFSGGLLDLLYERYGFLNPGPNDTSLYEGTFDWRSTCAVLGLSTDSQWVQELLAHNNNIHNNHIRQAISRFVEDLLCAPKKMPTALWDIHPDSQEPLQRNSNFKI